MKIAITSVGPSIKDLVDQKFGRGFGRGFMYEEPMEPLTEPIEVSQTNQKPVETIEKIEESILIPLEDKKSINSRIALYLSRAPYFGIVKYK